MTIPACVEIAITPDPIAVTLPGGVTIQQLNLIQAIQPALTPLMPAFNIIDAVMAVFQCIKAIPGSFGPPPDPSALISAISDLAKKVAKLMRLVPQLSLPYTILGVIDLVLDVLRTARAQLVQLQSRSAQLQTAIDRANALGDAGLLSITNCARTNIEREAANVGKTLGSFQALIDILNLFVGMIGGPTVPAMSSLAGQSLEQAIAPLDAIVQTLGDVRRAIPLP